MANKFIQKKKKKKIGLIKAKSVDQTDISDMVLESIDDEPQIEYDGDREEEKVDEYNL